jgi:hypothetical protein
MSPAAAICVMVLIAVICIAIDNYIDPGGEKNL